MPTSSDDSATENDREVKGMPNVARRPRSIISVDLFSNFAPRRFGEIYPDVNIYHRDRSLAHIFSRDLAERQQNTDGISHSPNLSDCGGDGFADEIPSLTGVKRVRFRRTKHPGMSRSPSSSPQRTPPKRKRRLRKKPQQSAGKNSKNPRNSPNKKVSCRPPTTNFGDPGDDGDDDDDDEDNTPLSELVFGAGDGVKDGGSKSPSGNDDGEDDGAEEGADGEDDGADKGADGEDDGADKGDDNPDDGDDETAGADDGVDCGADGNSSESDQSSGGG